MYKLLIRPLLFLFQPETIHSFVVKGMKFWFKIPGIACFIRQIASVNSTKTEKEVFGLKFKNPIGIAAGFDKQAEFFDELANFGFGFIEIGTVTPKPQPGNPLPRIFRLPNDKALINRMGFNNIGVDEAVKNLKKRKTNIIIGGNIGKNTLTPNENAVDDYIYCFDKLFDYVDYFVVNVSCPNVSDLRELQDQKSLMEILGKLQSINNLKERPKPILLKVSPDLNWQQLDEVIEIVHNTGICGVVATNTTITRDNLTVSTKRVQEIGDGGLSGLPLKNRSTEIIRYLSEKSGKAFPIIGVGGIFTPDDALEKIGAGADLVQVYTGFIYEGPFIAKKIVRKIISNQMK